MLGCSRLPDDHFKVFEAITAYAVVDKEEVYERLGHLESRKDAKGQTIKGYLTRTTRFPLTLPWL